MYKIGDVVNIHRAPTEEACLAAGFSRKDVRYWPGGASNYKLQWLADKTPLTIVRIEREGVGTVPHYIVTCERYGSDTWTILDYCVRKNKPVILIGSRDD